MALDPQLARRIRSRLRGGDVNEQIRSSFSNVTRKYPKIRMPSVSQTQSIAPTTPRSPIASSTISQGPEPSRFQKFKSMLPRGLREGLFGTGLRFSAEQKDTGLIGFLYEGLTRTEQEKYDKRVDKLVRAGVEPGRAGELAASDIAGQPVQTTPEEQSILNRTGLFEFGEKALELTDFVPVLGIGRRSAKKALETLANTTEVDQIIETIKKSFPEILGSRQLDDAVQAISQETSPNRIQEIIDATTRNSLRPEDILFYKRAPSQVDNSREAIAVYEDNRGKVAQSRDWFLRQAQDELIELRRIVENPNIKITDQSNPYDAEIAFHGRVGSRLEDIRKQVEQLDKNIISTSRDFGLADAQFRQEVNEYLIARHAPERNAILKQDGAAGITTEAAKLRLAELEGAKYSRELKRVADEIQELNRQTLDILREGDVITDDLYTLLRNRYAHHVPLQRVMDTEDDFAGALGRSFDVRGTGIRTARGSEREVADILGNVVYNYEQAVLRAEKNRVDLATLKMVRDNQEVLRDLFKIRKPKAVGRNFDNQLIMEKVTDPQTLVLREKGKPIFIEIKDPQLALAMRGVGRAKMSGMLRGVAAITRLYSGIHTRFNPEFAFSNKVRDLQEVLAYSAAQGELGVRQSAKIAAREARLESVRAVLDFLRGNDSEGARLYKQMRADGGTTGGMGLSTRKQIELDIEQIRKQNRQSPRKAAQKLLEYVDNWNTIFEDSSRLSVYRQALENGASRQRAAVLAKESSVNFNKFGQQGQIINALYIFANASIQGTTKMIRAMKNPKVAATVSTAVLSSVYAVSEWNDNIDPDWRNKITTWDRLNSLAILLPSTEEGGNVNYITIPVSWGIKPIKVMADELVDHASGQGGSFADSASSILLSVLEAYNPVGGTNLVSAVMPTLFDIPLEVARNQAWHGGRIRPDWDQDAPGSIQYFPSLRDRTTGRVAIGMARGLSHVGIEVSPANIHYAYEQLIGGAGRTVNKVVNTITSIGGETPLLPEDIPFASRFYKSRPEEQVGVGAEEYEMMQTMLQEQSRERFYLNQQAEDSLRQLDKLPSAQARQLFEEIKQRDPELADAITKAKKASDAGLTFMDRQILRLGVTNGERAKFLLEKFNSLETQQEKADLWNEYRNKGVISDQVAEQLKQLLKGGN